MSSTAARLAALDDLLALRGDLAGVVAILATFGWDSDADLVTLTPDHVRSVLERVASGELRAADAEAWADAIEGREDIGLLDDDRELLEDAIFTLANPALTEPLDLAGIERWQQRLRKR
jgi:hypothetical protein